MTIKYNSIIRAITRVILLFSDNIITLMQRARSKHMN